MANRLFPKAKQGLVDAKIDANTATMKLLLVRGYTYDSSDEFVSDMSGVTVVSTSAALSSVTITDGAVAAASTTFTAPSAGAACETIVLIQSSAVGGGSDVASSAQRVIAMWDGKIEVVAAAAASSSATSITVDPLVGALANGSTVTFGGVTATLTSAASLGARTLSVSALSGSIAQGTTGTSSAQGGLPITPAGVDITVNLGATLFTV